MRLATRRNSTPDGELVVVAADGAHAAPTSGIAATMQAALERWRDVEPALRALADAVAGGTAPGLTTLDPATLVAPLPRAWQWLDGSAYLNHGDLMQKAFRLPPIETDRPLMYQGLSDRFLGPHDDVRLPSEDDGIDFEGEVGVIVDAVPMGISAADALGHIRLIIQINDWSLRTIAPIEMKTGFGWVQAKPACSTAPFAITPDALGDRWHDGRLAAILETQVNGERFGAVDSGAEMAFGFHELVAHAARTRDLVAGTIIGSGTVSATNYAEVGSSCLSERRAIDTIAGRPLTPFLRFGDRVRMEARVNGQPIFGVIDQRVIAARTG
ncbi:fumarylacetoacetate hydrolase family protein [Sphingomonas sp. BAUL-RG-20F-R05-02]|uniref:fumarylacetoacetate hydrolase family protein n=1 Tax=Sphingomonas sp. BAUL-RG-20F-R05-02 TaxID=2914830 RepID=UPI001F583D37|nr:fumarylacetoacetate hydrolase family protein [Sphingomonas sp. BAUL-RG-20F-R05-02]